jgi:assimilatory nitrate reductase catalytic subunit
LLVQIEALLGLRDTDSLRYIDAQRGQRRTVRVEPQGEDIRVTGLLLGGDTRAEVWLKTLLQENLPAQAYGRLLLQPGAEAPVAVVSQGRTVCSCLGVTDQAIEAKLAVCQGPDEDRLGQLQGALKCGTNCGSCVPELKRMVRLIKPVTG